MPRRGARAGHRRGHEPSGKLRAARAGHRLPVHRRQGHRGRRARAVGAKSPRTTRAQRANRRLRGRQNASGRAQAAGGVRGGCSWLVLSTVRVAGEVNAAAGRKRARNRLRDLVDTVGYRTTHFSFAFSTRHTQPAGTAADLSAPSGAPGSRTAPGSPAWAGARGSRRTQRRRSAISRHRANAAWRQWLARTLRRPCAPGARLPREPQPPGRDARQSPLCVLL